MGSAKPSGRVEAVENRIVNEALTGFMTSLEIFKGQDQDYSQIIRRLLRLRGKVVFTGVGKSGHIGQKLAATFTSTGTPAVFVHATEASHGDMGILERQDMLIMLSASGATQELIDFALYAKEYHIPSLLITKKADSHLANESSHVLLIPDVDEGCPNKLAPTTSTLCQLALGDALAIALTTLKDFKPAEFKTFHPGGKLGSLLASVSDLMCTDDDLPIVPQSASLAETLVVMSSKGFGIAGVIDKDTSQLLAVFTDGDLRRLLSGGKLDVTQPIKSIANPKFQHMSPTLTVDECLQFLSAQNIPSCFVLDESNKVVGVVHLKLIA